MKFHAKISQFSKNMSMYLKNRHNSMNSVLSFPCECDHKDKYYKENLLVKSTFLSFLSSFLLLFKMKMIEECLNSNEISAIKIKCELLCLKSTKLVLTYLLLLHIYKILCERSPLKLETKSLNSFTYISRILLKI